MTDYDLIRRCDVLEILDNEGSLGRTRKLVEQLVAVTTEAQAAEIERLEKACSEWAEVSQSNYHRAKAAEAKLAKAVEALEGESHE